MNSLRFSGSPPDTCSAEMIVPCTTRISTPAGEQVRRELAGALRADPRGHGDPGLAHRAAAPRRAAPGWIGAACSSCSSRTGAVGSSSPAAASTRASAPSASACRAHRPSALSTAEPAELADRDRGRRRDDGVGRVGDQRDVEAVGVELPGGRHLLRAAGPPRRHDLDLRQVVAAPGLPAHPDLHEVTHGWPSVERPRTPAARGVVGRLDGHRDVVRVALLEPRRGDPHQLRLLQLRRSSRAPA